jgi:ubiquinone/menaquinone biosynthesis C-methylase UbiE
LHAFLDLLPNLAYSEYQGNNHRGEVVDGVRSEDICSLTYPDASFDLVLSSDTLEHVPDFRLALRETRRVLRPGGRHVFTVPIVGSRPTTEPRAHVAGDGSIEHVLPPLYHGRGAGLYRHLPVGQDLLTFTEFGSDLTDHMREAGFEPEVVRADARDESGATWVFSGRVPC